MGKVVFNTLENDSVLKELGYELPKPKESNEKLPDPS
jgi:hypothetical protein